MFTHNDFVRNVRMGLQVQTRGGRKFIEGIVRDVRGIGLELVNTTGVVFITYTSIIATWS